MSTMLTHFPSPYSPYSNVKLPGVQEMLCTGFVSSTGAGGWNSIGMASIVYNTIASAFFYGGNVLIPPGIYDLFAQVQYAYANACVLRLTDAKSGNVIFNSPASYSQVASYSYVSSRIFGRAEFPNGAEIATTAWFGTGDSSNNIKDQQLKIRKIS